MPFLRSRKREHPMRSWICLLAWTIGAPIAPAFSVQAVEPRTTQFDGVDVFGTTRLDSDRVWNALQTDFAVLANAIASRDPAAIKAQKAKIAASLKAQGPFAYVALSPIRYYPPASGLYVTIDVVESQDVARRMPFRAPPTKEFRDPDGLLSAWYEYESAVGTLAAKDQLPQSDQCPVLHCLASFNAASLAPWLKRFNDGVRTNRDLLTQIATDDADARHRTAALYLLAHTNDATLLLPLLSHAIFDADPMVRNAGMRVMSGMARRRVDADYPIDAILAALDFPETTDRNKAAYVVDGLVQFPRYKEAVLAGGLSTLIRLLKLKQPNNHDIAFAILKKISGEAYSERDYARWESWAAKAASGMPRKVPAATDQLRGE